VSVLGLFNFPACFSLVCVNCTGERSWNYATPRGYLYKPADCNKTVLSPPAGCSQEISPVSENRSNSAYSQKTKYTYNVLWVHICSSRNALYYEGFWSIIESAYSRPKCRLCDKPFQTTRPWSGHRPTINCSRASKGGMGNWIWHNTLAPPSVCSEFSDLMALYKLVFNFNFKTAFYFTPLSRSPPRNWTAVCPASHEPITASSRLGPAADGC